MHVPCKLNSFDNHLPVISQDEDLMARFIRLQTKYTFNLDTVGGCSIKIKHTAISSITPLISVILSFA